MARGQTDYGPPRIRECRKCGASYVHHFFSICKDCRPDVTDRDAAYIPTEEEIAKGCEEAKRKHLEEMAEKPEGRRGLDENNIRVYSASLSSDGSSRCVVWNQR
jgi:hypothetical protein